MTSLRTDRSFFLLACLVLTLGTLALYWPASHSPFIFFDDVDFISANPHVNGGLSWSNLAWAFHDTHTGNWMPLTWLTHMLDCQWFGVNAGAEHLVSVGLHIANSLLLLAFLQYTTGARWRSAFVAALFAWHPLHVESVAWASERKDVLSAFFFLLTLTAYARYAALAKIQSAKAKVFYALALGWFALGLMSKPMVVTLPFVLLLLDFWPLGRIPKAGFRMPDLKNRLVEKIPFFILSATLCAATFLAQRGAGAVTHIAWSSRLTNVPVAYLRYISKTFCPTDLSIYYPYIHNWPPSVIFGSGLLLILFSGLAISQLRSQPWLAAGWFWFLGTLVPVIGFVQAGMQSMANRYVYIPSIGLFILIVWGAGEVARHRINLKKFLPFIGGAALVGCLTTTAIQLSYWQSNVKLFLHAVDTTTDNYVALNSLGCALQEVGRDDDAIRVFQESIRVEPNYWPSRRNLALALLKNHQPDEAFNQFETVLAALPDDADLRYEVSLYLLQYKHPAAAKTQLAAALHINPRLAAAHELLGAIFLQESNLDEAIPQFFQALQANPGLAEAQFNLGLATEQQGKCSEAVAHFRAALRLAPDSIMIKTELDRILAAHPELKPQP